MNPRLRKAPPINFSYLVSPVHVFGHFDGRTTAEAALVASCVLLGHPDRGVSPSEMVTRSRYFVAPTPRHC